MQRRRSLPHTFEGQIAAEISRLEAVAAELPHGSEKDKVLRKIRQLNTASHMGDWLSSGGLKPPK